MPSILPGYEYDIFISYRQNDNRSDKWVTNFVSALKEELEATLKNPVSIYFDENPHDGLLETHQVDASLAKKLKCLVFIPIISQTYCDESCFAWEHEFMPFIKMAKEDGLGMNVTLSNGNVVSRVLPVKIHDLDAEDQHTLEAVLDGPLRSIDFIYGVAGVNRPLRAKEDDPSANLNKTYYRDQINKVANALKDIGVSMLRSTKTEIDESPAGAVANVKSKTTAPGTSDSKQKLVIPLAIIAVLILAFFWLKPLLFQGNEVKDIGEVGIAIIPFKNIGNNDSINFLSTALIEKTQEILSLSKQFAFLSSRMATAVYTNQDVSPKKIGEELGVDYVLAGLFRLSGEQLIINVELVDANTGNSIWQKPYEIAFREDNIYPLQTKLASDVLASFNVKSDNTDIVERQFNFESYSHYIKGLEWVQKGFDLENRQKAISEFEQAINLDSTHTQSWIELIECKANLLFHNLAPDTVYIPEIESHLDFLSENHPQWASELAQGIYQYHVLGNYDEGLKHIKKVAEQYPGNEMANSILGGIYKRKLKIKYAFNNVLKLISSDPQNTLYWNELSGYFRINGDYKRQLQSYYRALELGFERYSSLPYMYKKASIPLDSIPAKYRTSDHKEFLVTKIWSGNKPRTIMEQLKDIPLDQNPGSNNYTKTEHYHDLAVCYFALSLDDSASYYANLCITSNEQQEKKEWSWVAESYSILGEHEKSQDIRKRRYTLDDTEDLLLQMNVYQDDIYNLVLGKKYTEATELLIELNREFPEYGDYFFLTYFYYDRAKKEYPPFAEAVANLKLPPPLVEDNQLERLKY
jgi:TolB-like protein